MLGEGEGVTRLLYHSGIVTERNLSRYGKPGTSEEEIDQNPRNKRQHERQKAKKKKLHKRPPLRFALINKNEVELTNQRSDRSLVRRSRGHREDRADAVAVQALPVGSTAHVCIWKKKRVNKKFKKIAPWAVLFFPFVFKPAVDSHLPAFHRYYFRIQTAPPH